MPPVEAWERVYVDAETYTTTDVHAFIGCTACHGGTTSYNMDEAHTGMLEDPSADPVAGCGSCHPNIAPYAAESLHMTLEGYDTALHQRSDPANYETLEQMETYHCNNCHATCGDCHVSQPDSVGGGLLEGHVFVQTPPMSQTCTACHGSRVKNEYYGLNEGIPGDVHLREARMACVDCHTSAEMHGLPPFDQEEHRYDAPQSPTCESCHEDQIGVGSGIPEHEVHGTDLLSCQVCHSTDYTNCTNCHVDRTEDDVPYYSVEEHWTTFLIGQNPDRTTDRPYKYVTVRHVPVDIDSFSAYGDDLLNNFLNRPTWSYATPHNTQLDTEQALTCTNCHDNDDVFLTADKVAPAELEANHSVIVEAAPAFPEGYEDYLATQEPAAETPAEGAGSGETSGDAGFWGSDDSATEDEVESGDAGFWGADESSAPAETPAGDESFWGDAPDAESTAAPSGDESFWGSESAPAGGEAVATPPATDADFWGG
ncbi:hypothetical protein [Aggregatilinea lenta]|uniref:hypothetical protein n=1 Tax=Aggregatilinea lenta TaxID=913108 RepID=UPI0013C30D35|nr:hypothetical protein [Aggregatilinea lenta]